MQSSPGLTGPAQEIVSSMLIRVWAPSILCSINQTHGFHAPGYLVVLVGSWHSIHHAHFQAPERKEGGRDDWGIPFQMSQLSLSTKPTTISFTLYCSESSYVVTPSCTRVAQESGNYICIP